MAEDNVNFSPRFSLKRLRLNAEEYRKIKRPFPPLACATVSALVSAPAELVFEPRMPGENQRQTPATVPRADRKFKALFAPPRRPRPPQHPPPPAPPHPGLLHAAPRAVPARQRGLQPGGARRRATFAGAGQAPPHGVGRALHGALGRRLGRAGGGRARPSIPRRRPRRTPGAGVPPRVPP